jgi:hypothetical protein
MRKCNCAPCCALSTFSVFAIQGYEGPTLGPALAHVFIFVSTIQGHEYFSNFWSMVHVIGVECFNTVLALLTWWYYYLSIYLSTRCWIFFSAYLNAAHVKRPSITRHQQRIFKNIYLSLKSSISQSFRTPVIRPFHYANRVVRLLRNSANDSSFPSLSISCLFSSGRSSSSSE